MEVKNLGPEKVRTPFGEFEKPCFPRAIDPLNEIFGRIKINDTTLKEIAKKIEGCSVTGVKFEKAEEQPTTKDGYIWRLALYFQVLDYKELIGKVVVLFPIQSNRSIAIYADYVEGTVDTEATSNLQFAIYYLIPEALQKALLKVEQEQKQPQEDVVSIQHT